MASITLSRDHLAKEYLNTFVFAKDYSIVDDILSDNSILHRNLGTCYGKESTVEKISTLAKSLDPIQILSCEETIMGQCAFYKFRQKMKHTDTFSSIKATGRIIEYDAVAMFDLTSEKIERATISTNVESIIDQISSNTEEKEFALGQALLTTIPFYEIYDAARLHLVSNDIDITIRQFAHLCLWCMGKSDSEVETILDISRRTAHYYQDKLKMKFNCYSKSQLIEKTKSLNLTHLLREGFIQLISIDPSKSKLLFS